MKFRLPRLRSRHWMLFGTITVATTGAVIAGCLAAFGAVGMGATAGNNSATSSPPGPGSSASDQATWLCSKASHDTAANVATPFLAYVASTCSKIGAQGIVSESASAGSNEPIGYLMCQYAQDQVANGTASTLDQSAAKGCAETEPPQQTGIIDSPDQPPSSFQIVATNSWVGQVGGQSVVIWAGAQAARLPDGSLGNPNVSEVVEFVQPNTPGPLANARVLGSSDGALTITGSSNNTLQLAAKDGTPYEFDMSTETLSRG